MNNKLTKEATTLPLTDLTPFHKNPRLGNTQAIADSLKTNGQFKPLVVNKGTHTGRPMEVLAGNHTLQAMQQLQWETADIWLIDATEDEATRIVLADNRTSDLATYNDELLLELLNATDTTLEGTGYDSDYLNEINNLLNATDTTPTPEEADNTNAERNTNKTTITQPGDIIELGQHRVYCGDATDTTNILQKLMHDGKANCIWTDPPYGVEYIGKTKDNLTIVNDNQKNLRHLLDGAMTTIKQAANPGAPFYIAHADSERINFQQAVEGAGLIFRQNLIWVKNTIVLGHSDYHYKHEPILYGFTPNGQGRLGRGGDRWYGDNAQSTVFLYDKPARNAQHPTMKPVALIQHMLKNSCPAGGIVLDVFGGSGTTLLAAHIHKAKARIVELDPRYVDVICRRYQELTGETPTRNGQPLNYIEETE